MNNYLSKLHILVRFIDDGKYDVLRLKKAVTLEDTVDISSWDSAANIDILWHGATYPGNIIQFGENKKEMEELIDKLGNKLIPLSDIPLIQDPIKLAESQAASKSVTGDASTILQKKQKLHIESLKSNAANGLIDAVKAKILEEENKPKACNDCIILKKKISCLEEENSKEKSVVTYQAEKILKLESKVEKLKRKCTKYKEKCRKSSVATTHIEEDQTNIGSVRVPTNKLNMCRTSNYSKFVGDLLEVVFGREVLARSLIKGIKNGSSKKTNILNPEIVRDIQVYVSKKFNVDETMVRTAIRRKLNVVDSRVKEVSN